MDHSSTINQWLGNVFSVGAIVGTLMGWAPAIAAFVALIWYVIQIYESETVRRWASLRKKRRLARLKARVESLEAEARLEAPEPSDEN